MSIGDRDHLLVIIPSGTAAVIAALLSLVTGIKPVFLILMPVLVTLLMYAYAAGRRSHRIEGLSAAVRRVLGGSEDIDLSQYKEGELYVLAADLQKVAGAYREQAKALKQDKRDLLDAISDISHQLKTPITSLYVVSDVLKQPLRDEERHNFEAQLDSQIERLDWLVKSLLTLAKLDAAAVTFKPNQTTLGTLIERAAEPFRIKADLADLDLLTEGDLDESLWIDENWAIEALGNVVKNAVEHATPSSSVILRARNLPMSRQIQVINRGATIPPPILNHLFDRFYRQPDAPPDSSGIGLSISKAILNAQGGRIRAESKDGVTVFELSFPK